MAPGGARGPRLVRVLEVGAGRPVGRGLHRSASARPRPLLAGPELRLEATRGASDVAVGGADLVGCELAGRDGFDRVYVEILWSARFGAVSGADPLPGGDAAGAADRRGLALVDDRARLPGLRRAARRQ